MLTCVDKQWINNSTAEESLDIAVAIPGNILTATPFNLFVKMHDVLVSLFSSF